MFSTFNATQAPLHTQLCRLIASALLLTPWALAAEPVRVPESEAPAPHLVDALDAPTVDEWVAEEVTAQGLLEAIDRAQTEVVAQPYHQRASTWVQNVTAVQDADTQRGQEDAARAQRDRATIEWLLADDAERQQASAAMSGAVAAPAATRAASSAAWQRGVVIPLLLALMVSAGLTWLVRRPRRGANAASSDSADSSAASSRRRRRSRRHRVADQGSPEPAAVQPPAAQSSKRPSLT